MRKDRTLDKVLKELKEKNREVRIHVDGTAYNGKIKSITKDYVNLVSYVVGEAINTKYGQIERIRIEENIPLPIRKKDIKVPMPLSDGYLESVIKSTNKIYSNLVRDNSLRKELFESYLMPDEEDFENQKTKTSEFKNQSIGFKQGYMLDDSDKPSN
jgi:hypothetical protein